MFARPKNSYNRQASNGGGFQGVDKTFTEYITPLVSRSSIEINNDVLEAQRRKDEAQRKNASSSRLFNNTAASSNRFTNSRSMGTADLKINRTGDAASYRYATNDKMYIDRNSAKRGYRILSYKEDLHGRKVVFDLLEGTVYYCGKISRRVTKNVLVFDNKQAAMSERLPPNQVGHSKHGNGLYPRVLVSFDYWGKCMRRLGGGSSLLMENVKFTGIVKFLDPPCPVQKRMVDRYVEPFFFVGPDHHQPGREISDRVSKTERTFFPHDLKY